MKCFYHYPSPLGAVTLESDGECLTGLYFDGQRYFDIPAASEYTENVLPVFGNTVKWLDIYFSGKDPDFTPELRLNTTPFSKEVCGIMLKIPYGHLMTYGQIADLIAKRKGIEKMSAQAVGGAVGHNPISVIIPCHRVVGTGGSLTGYGGGIGRKVWLLQHEGIDFAAEKLFIPTKGTAL